MAAGRHDPSRRALLGAAVALPLIVAADDAGEAQGPLHHASPDGCCAAGSGSRHAPGMATRLHPPPRPGEEWQTALAAFRAAAAKVLEIEAATAGYGFEEEEALLPAHDASCEAMDAALRRMLFVPAPDLAALAVKLELFFDHALEPHSVEEDVVAAIRADAGRLAGE